MNLPAAEVMKMIEEKLQKLIQKHRIRGTYGYVQVENKYINDMNLHYEFIFGGNNRCKNSKGVEKNHIYTEFHAEDGRNSRSKLEHLCRMIEALPHDDSIQVVKKTSGKNFDVKYGQGVPLVDGNGAERAESDIIDDLKQQLIKLKAFMDDTLNAFVSDTGLEYALADKRSLLESSKQLILTGAPGTGKTFTAKQLAKKWIAETNGSFAENFCQVQFHPGYDYSDFIIGLKPELVNGKVTFKWKDGLFKAFADKAKKFRETDGENCKPYIFLIDEINRADLSRVFGEVFSLLEEDYRYPENETGIILPDGSSFVLPDNLYIIATMNDIDRSVESMDFALRRRFSFLEVKAEDSVCIIEENTKISDGNKAKLKNVMAELNKYIGSKNELLDNRYHLDLGDEYALGGAYFVHFAKYADEEQPQEMLWGNHLHIILNEYLRGHRDRHAILTCLKNVFDSAWNGSLQ